MSNIVDIINLRWLLENLRVSDLQSLLRTVSKDKYRKKDELVQRILAVVNSPPAGVNMTALYAKLSELTLSNNIHINQPNILPGNEVHSNAPAQGLTAEPGTQNSYRSTVSETSNWMVGQQSRNYNYNNYAQPRPNQPRIQIRPQYLQNGNQRCSSNTAGILSSTPDQNRPTQAVPTSSGNGKGSGGAETYGPLQELPELRFKDLPFYKVLATLVKPTTLIPNSAPLDINGMKFEEFSIKFRLTVELATAVAINRDVSDGKTDYPIQILLRMCSYQNPYSLCEDHLPSGLLVRLCDAPCPLPPLVPSTTKSTTGTRRQPWPINLSHEAKLSPVVTNDLIINWSMEMDKRFALTVCVAEKIEPDTLLAKLKTTSVVDATVTRELVVSRFMENEGDDDLSATILHVSLQCPLGACRLVYPAKGRSCTHLQCFDASSYIHLNDKKPSWICPVCNKFAYYEELEIYQYFINILESEHLPSNCKEVQLLCDGSWKACEHVEEDGGLRDESMSKSQPLVDLVEMEADGEEEDSELNENKEAEEVSNTAVASAPASEVVDLTDD